jgi:sugar phosphate isomerase/epimerase
VEHSLEEVKEIKRQLDERGFKVSSVGSPLGKIKITDDFAPHLDLFKHTLEIAKILESPFIRIFSFYIPKGEDPASYRDEVIGRLQQFVEVAKGSSVILAHENEKGIYGDTAERCLDILQTLDCDYVKAVFDPANFVQCGVKTYPEAFSLLKDYVAYLHIKDAVYADGRVVPAGQGDGKVKEILTDLHESGFEGFLSLEPHLAKFQGFEALEPGDVGFDLPEGGPRQFAIAANALKRLLVEVKGL